MTQTIEYKYDVGDTVVYKDHWGTSCHTIKEQTRFCGEYYPVYLLHNGVYVKETDIIEVKMRPMEALEIVKNALQMDVSKEVAEALRVLGRSIS